MDMVNTNKALRDMAEQLHRQLDTNGRYHERDLVTIFKALKEAHELPRARKKKK